MVHSILLHLHEKIKINEVNFWAKPAGVYITLFNRRWSRVLADSGRLSGSLKTMSHAHPPIRDLFWVDSELKSMIFLVSSPQKVWISTNSDRKIPRLIVIWSEWQPISCSLPTVLSFGSLSGEFCLQSFRKYTQNLISSAREWKETVTKAIEKSLRNHCPRLQIVRNHQSVSGYAIWGPNIRPNCSFQNLPKPGFKILRYSCRFWPKVHLIKFSFFLEIQQNGVPHRIERIFLPRIQLKKWEIDELFFECFSRRIVLRANPMRSSQMGN